MRIVEESRVALRPLTPDDYPVIGTWLGTDGIGQRWRGVGSIPADQVGAFLWNGALEQAVVCRRDDGAPVGLVTAYNYESRSAHVTLGVVEAPHAIGSGVALVGVGLFLSELFQEWPLRKVYIELYAFNLPVLGAIDGWLARREAILRDDTIRYGELQDLHLFCVDRADWESGLGLVARARIDDTDHARTGGAVGRDRRESSRPAESPADEGALLDFDAFARELAAAMDVDAARLDEDAPLAELTDLDSLELVRLLVTIEELADAIDLPDDLPALGTLGDAYGYYRRLVAGARDVPVAAEPGGLPA